MTNMNGIGPVVDLGEIQRRQHEKAQVPPYSVGSPEFVAQVGVERVSFRDALDRTAIMLNAEGFTIEEVKNCAFAGVDQSGAAVFQVVVRVSETEPAL
jgi:hypothetical protein